MVVCTFLLILFASIGFLSPANRGSIIIGMSPVDSFFLFFIYLTYVVLPCFVSCSSQPCFCCSC